MAQRGSRDQATDPGFQDLVREDLKTGRFRPVYLLAGEDTLRIEGVVEKIRKDALGEAGAAFNYHVLRGDQVPVGRVVQQALALPMLGRVQVIWLKQADACFNDADSQAALEKYLGKPVPETILIMSTDKADKRKRWVKLCQSSGFYFDFTPPSGEALVQWILKAAQKEGLPLGAEQARLLVELVGGDLLSLKSEIDKLALMCDDRGRAFTAEELGAVIMDQAALEGYEITAALEPGRAAEVLRTWFRLQEWGRSAHEIAPLLLARIRKGALLAACRQEGLRDAETAALSAQNPYALRFLEPMVRGMGLDGLTRGLDVALDADRRLKGSPLGPDLVVEKMILELCRRPDAGRLPASRPDVKRP
jgi:DNA polymerase-3 subunit delta